ncbi:uncharacterized protein LOC126565220 isoform X2 [Anopheles maculipalpis]|uniref:uncharacterized protein LOC126565220 isoform X2 n=1 Tax=Anopheles maculipalpis TaxID=1496333 RepID=UPI0021596D24|nr:uncharacterized protein LOC126565220 isoform X2 [Anopheles maculipalpis]
MQHYSPASVLVYLILVYSVVRGAPNDGKYNPRKYNKNGKYVHRGEDYVEDLSRYRYVHYDDGDRGRYFHIHIPYDGGYGNYEGGHEPYRFPPYDPAGEYAEQINKYSYDPFRANSYDIKKPSIYLEYGVPSVSETNTASSVVDVRKSLLPGPGTAYLPVPESGELDVRKSLLPGLGTGYLPVLTPQEQSLAIEQSEKRSKVLPHPNSIDGVDHLTTTASHDNSARATTRQSSIESTTVTNIGTDRADRPTDESLHNHPCIATSGPLKLVAKT